MTGQGGLLQRSRVENEAGIGDGHLIRVASQPQKTVPAYALALFALYGNSLHTRP